MLSDKQTEQGHLITDILPECGHVQPPGIRFGARRNPDKPFRPRHHSHDVAVCGVWRDRILESPSIWGRILQLKRMRELGKEGREEIMKRTGSAPLYIMGPSEVYEELQSQESFRGAVFFDTLLWDNWPRVRKLHVRIGRRHESVLTSLLLRPAPSLESLSAYFLHINSNSNPRYSSHALFRGAPSLRHWTGLPPFKFNLLYLGSPTPNSRVVDERN
ncbi:hypothetical protein CPB84DRAFT_1890648 [Gymnopilus junonius]|uniref:Uncharacterized protein n=1 Tax=Gymnopilus junonius TaxID=109634 RepID=A0A9P5NC69_GYMJU|nr:hypothetical protein CPB84DRAFT_1890648 [Gymnopilus junonius]